MGRILRGEPGDFAKGAHVKLRLDRERRDASMLNHSATHILHYALRDILGNDVHQAGSMVAPERLRFDFSHNGPVAAGDLATIEEEINARIRENAAVVTEEMAYDDALKAGALAFFGDKYGDVVRVVRMGDFSTELCGGTHVNRTGDVGIFKLESEGGVAAGVRRIEAFTGQGALEAIRRREKILDDIGGHLGARDGAALERLEKLLAREKELEKKLRALEQKLVAGRPRRGRGRDGARGQRRQDRHAQGRRGRGEVVARDGRSAAAEVWIGGGRDRLGSRREQGRADGGGDGGPGETDQGGRYRQANRADCRRHRRRAAGFRASRRPRRLEVGGGAGSDRDAGLRGPIEKQATD